MAIGVGQDRAAANGGAERVPSARWALASLSLSMVLSALGTSIANVGLPTLALAFDASFQDVQWIVLSYLLAITTLIVSVGRLGDLVGRRRLLLAGLVLFTAASLLCGLAPSLWLLIAARAAQGLGAAVMMALTLAFVGETVPKARTGSAMGLLGTMSAIGTALGPSLGGILIDGLGWRAIFLVTVPLGILAFALARRFLPANHSSRPAPPAPSLGTGEGRGGGPGAALGQPTSAPARGLLPTSARSDDRAAAPSPTLPRAEGGRKAAGFDMVGTLLLALTLATYALAMTIGRGSFGPLNLALLLAAGGGLGLFVLVEAKTASPLIRLARFRDPLLSAGLAANTLVAAVMMATLVVGPFYLARSLGLDPALVGIVMAIGPAISTVSGVPAGRIVDRLGAPSVVVVGLVAMAAGAFALSVLPDAFGIAGYVAAIAVLTPGYQLFQAANNTAVMADVPADQRGVTSGLLNLSRNLGLITGASAMGAVFALAAGAREIATARPEAVAAGMQVTFAVAGILIVVALAIAAGSRALATRRSLPEDGTGA